MTEVDKTRRRILISAPSLIILAGCTGEAIGDSREPTPEPTPQCHIETDTIEEEVLDEWETVSAGSSLSYRLELEEGDQVSVTVIQTDGARPTLQVLDNNQQNLIETDVSERIERTFTAHRSGRYYIQIENTAILTSGTWDVDVWIKRDIEREVCE